MSVNASLSISGKIGDKAFAVQKSIVGDGHIGVDVSVPAAKIGQLTTRTDNDTGVVTMASGHGFATSDKIDVYWTEAGVRGARYGMDATVATNAVTLDGGAGENLPTNMTAVTAMKQLTETFVLTGSNLAALMIYVQAQAVVQLKDADSAEYVKSFKYEDVDYWHNEKPEANPVTGDSLLTVVFSHGDSAAARIIRVGAVYT